MGEVFFFNFGSKSRLVAGTYFFVLERKRIFNFSESLNTFCSWKINVSMYGVLWGHLFKWKKIRCQVWKFRYFFKLCFGICGIFFKFEISGFRAGFGFRQALSRFKPSWLSFVVSQRLSPGSRRVTVLFCSVAIVKCRASSKRNTSGFPSFLRTSTDVVTHFFYPFNGLRKVASRKKSDLSQFET